LACGDAVGGDAVGAEVRIHDRRLSFVFRRNAFEERRTLFATRSARRLARSNRKAGAFIGF
jgi:hypothetical protein